MTEREYDRYKGLEYLKRQINNFEISKHFNAQTDRWGLNKTGGRFVTDLKTLLTDTLEAIKKEQEEL
jgi:hypothetical protein